MALLLTTALAFLTIWTGICICLKTTECSTADQIVSVAKSEIGSHNYSSNAEDRSGMFINRVILRVGMQWPGHIWLLGATMISAKDWADPSPKTHCYVSCTGHPAVPGDFLAENGHVAVVTGSHVTTGPELIGGHTGVVKETDWGFRSGQHPTCWRYSTEGYCAHLFHLSGTVG